MLSIRALTKSFPGPQPRLVLHSIDLDLALGDYVAVMGESGVGKSTLLNLIAGLDRPDSGSIALDDVELTTQDDDALTRLRRSAMGFVFQAFHILPYLTVAENVALPLALLGVERAEARARAATMLVAVGLDGRGPDPPRQLSGGELQRVAIARALIHAPRIVLIDEPTGNLDPESAQQVLRLLRERLDEASAIGVLVTHSQAAAQTTDRVLTLTRDGLRAAEAGR